MWTPSYFVYTVQLPLKVLGATIPNTDGTYSIYINQALPDAWQRRTLEHEVKHVYLDHFYQDIKSVRVIENEADGRPGKSEPVQAPAPVVAAEGQDEDWLYDPYGFPLGPMPEHPEGTRIIPLYPNLNAILKPWKDNGLLEDLLGRAK